ncbi:MAG: SPOR domain-containing protein, partial [Gemmatimonadales bacterium]
MLRPLFHSALLALVLPACSETPKELSGTISVETPVEHATLLRIPRDGGEPQLYHLPALSEYEDWALRETLPNITEVVGVNLDDRLVYLHGDKDQILSLDLETRNVRTVLPEISSAVVGPDGTLFAVTDSNQVWEVARRTMNRYTEKLPGPPAHLFGALGSRLLAVTGGDVPRIVRVTGAQPTSPTMLPEGDVAATFWGDLVAVAADTAVVFFDPALDPPAPSREVDGHAIDVVFSPSGHRVYVLRRDESLLILDRFNEYDELGDIDLPGTPAAIRSDPYGQWLLVRTAGRDSAWIVNTVTGKVVAAAPTVWGPVLPTVVSSRILLLAEEGDVVAYDLSEQPWREVGRIPDAAGDAWVPLAWRPDDGTTTGALTDDSVTADSVTAAGEGEPVYLQVSSSRNQEWAEDLSDKLREAGLPATVLPPSSADGLSRVVLGPYRSR